MGKRVMLLFMVLFLAACSNGDEEEAPNETTELPETNPQVQLYVNGEAMNDYQSEMICWLNCDNDFTGEIDTEAALEEFEPIPVSSTDVVSLDIVWEETPESVQPTHLVGYRTSSNLYSPAEIDGDEYAIEDVYSFNPVEDALHIVQTNFADDEGEILGSMALYFLVTIEE